jgi:putative intracellular protease/amidase
MTTKGKVLIIVGDATETVDTSHPRHCLNEAGVDPAVASLAMPFI